MHVFRLDCLSFIISPSLIRLCYSRQLFSAFDSVSAFSISLPCFQFIALASIILPRSRCRPRSQSFVYSLFHLVSLTRHPNNMSPIVTFLVSGLPLFIRRYVALILFCLGAAASPFILGFLAMSPVPFMASCFSVRRRTSWLLPPRGFEDPRKTSLPSRRYDDIASRLWV
jgi:hypothetical protein